MKQLTFQILKYTGNSSEYHVNLLGLLNYLKKEGIKQ